MCVFNWNSNINFELQLMLDDIIPMIDGKHVCYLSL